MKKILIFHPYLAPYRIDLYNKLSTLYIMKVLLTGSLTERNTLGFDLSLVNKSAKFDFKYIEKGLYLGRHLISNVYIKIIKSFRPDVILAHELGFNTILAILLKPHFNFKIFVTIDDSPSMVKNYSKLRSILRDFVVRNVECLLVVHPEVKSYLEACYHLKGKCRFLYFPIIQDEVILRNKLAQATDKAFEYYQINNLQGKKVFLFVGRLESKKCPDILIDAYMQLGDTDSVLVFVGDGSMNYILRNKVKKLNIESRVLFNGQLSGDDLFAWYRLADVFVLPSQFEPFGAVINEALVAGCKIVTSDKVGANCLIEENINGIIFKCNDVKDLVDKLRLVSLNVHTSKVLSTRMSLLKVTFNSLVTQFQSII